MGTSKPITIMKYTFQLLCSLVLAITQYNLTNAQGTELFEGATPGATSFTNNGKTFNLATNAPAFLSLILLAWVMVHPTGSYTLTTRTGLFHPFRFHLERLK